MAGAIFLILEDNDDRFGELAAALTDAFPGCVVKRWVSAHDMIAALDEHLAAATLISLDHDLYAPPGKPDPSDGLSVARHLTERAPTCPVIVHSSNSEQADRMQGVLEMEGWRVKRVLPFGEDWVRRDWLVLVRELIQPAPS